MEVLQLAVHSIPDTVAQQLRRRELLAARSILGTVTMVRQEASEVGRRTLPPLRTTIFPLRRNFRVAAAVLVTLTVTETLMVLAVV